MPIDPISKKMRQCGEDIFGKEMFDGLIPVIPDPPGEAPSGWEWWLIGDPVHCAGCMIGLGGTHYLARFGSGGVPRYCPPCARAEK